MKSSNMPPGAATLFFTQIFSNLGFAVLMSSLVLYTTSTLNMSADKANSIVGGFIAFNFTLHLFGGYLGGRFLSFRSLFLLGMLLQVLGLSILSTIRAKLFYLGLGCFLTGSGLNITSLNMMLTQLFVNHDPRREAAFLWNYSGMNIGFFLGFSVAGYFQISQNYQDLFLIASLGNAIAAFIIIFNWKKLYDRHTVLETYTPKKQRYQMIIGLCIMFLLIPTLQWLLHFSQLSNQLVLLVGISAMLCIYYLSFKQKSKLNKQKIHVYLIFAASSLVFWALYLLAPMGLTLFAKYNVERNILGIEIMPQWIQNINTFVIILGGPLMVKFLRQARNRGAAISLPTQFYIAMLLIGAGFLLLPVGIFFANTAGLVNFSWLFFSYVLQSIGELFISPIGYAMVGLLAPTKLQSFMMGAWMMVTGVAAIISSYFSNFALGNAEVFDPLLTNHSYGHTFLLLGIAAIVTGLILMLLKPYLLRLMADHA